MKPQRIPSKELKRLKKLNQYEDQARIDGFSIVAGVDEAGRGPLAGPVVAASCIIPEGKYFPGIDDSKKLTPEKRAKLFQDLITQTDVVYGVGIVSHEEIDQINIFQATIKAMLEAIDKLPKPPDKLLVDGMKLPSKIPAQKIIKGDSLSQSIAAASIIAKETRDRIMEGYDQTYPEYGFRDHKGYATRRHREAILKYGPCPIHRITFNLLNNDCQCTDSGFVEGAE